MNESNKLKIVLVKVSDGVFWDLPLLPPSKRHISIPATISVDINKPENSLSHRVLLLIWKYYKLVTGLLITAHWKMWCYYMQRTYTTCQFYLFIYFLLLSTLSLCLSYEMCYINKCDLTWLTLLHRYWRGTQYPGLGSICCISGILSFFAKWEDVWTGLVPIFIATLSV